VHADRPNSFMISSEHRHGSRQHIVLRTPPAIITRASMPVEQFPIPLTASAGQERAIHLEIQREMDTAGCRERAEL
jgi:hypothetical protein